MMEDLIGQLIFFLIHFTGYTFMAWIIIYFSLNADVGKGVSSGKTAPVPKTLPVRRPRENEE